MFSDVPVNGHCFVRFFTAGSNIWNNFDSESSLDVEGKIKGIYKEAEAAESAKSAEAAEAAEAAKEAEAAETGRAAEFRPNRYFFSCQPQTIHCHYQSGINDKTAQCRW